MKLLTIALRLLFFVALGVALFVETLETAAFVTVAVSLVALLVLRWRERSRRPVRSAVT